MHEHGVILEVADGVATITLDNPGKLNALSDLQYRTMRRWLARVRDDEAVSALVITGAGKAFCVGADLDYLERAGAAGRSLGEEVGELMATECNPLILELQALPVPVLAAVNGPVAGAGVGIALAADVVIAARSAFFYLPFASKLALIPDLGATWFLPRMTGRARSLALALLGDRLPAATAAEWGLIWSCVDDGELPAQTSALARRLAGLPRGLALEMRQAWERSGQNDLAAQLGHERDRQMGLLDSAQFREGLRAFHEKRAPRWTP